MKYAHLSTLGSAMTLALATLSAGQALAEDPGMPKTRAEVRQELEDAKKMGEIPANDESGLLLRDVYPSRYPAKAKDPSPTREQVRMELEEAQRAGEIPANDESGLQLHELYPSRYPPQESGPRLTREQVRQELERARKAGEIPMPPGG